MVGRWMVVMLAALGLMLAAPGCGGGTKPKTGTSKKTTSKKKSSTKKTAEPKAPAKEPEEEDEMPAGEEDDD